MNVGIFISRAATFFGDRTALYEGDRKISFKALDEITNRLAHALVARGVKVGDRVAFMLPNSLAWIVLDFAVMKAGAMSVPVSLRLHVKEMAKQIEMADCRLLVGGEGKVSEVSAILGNATPDTLIVGSDRDLQGLEIFDDIIAPASARPICIDVDHEACGRVMRFTSGTTGNSKAVFLNHRNWLANAHGLLLDRWDLKPDDVILATSPYAHAGGLWMLPALMRGSAMQVTDRFDAEEVIRFIDAGRASVLQVVPTALRRLLDTPLLSKIDLSKLRSIHYGGAPIDDLTLAEGLQRIGPKLVQGYGLNEACMVCTLGAADHEGLLQSQSSWQQPLGRETCLVELKLADKDGQPVPVGEPGEIAIRGRLIFKEYWNNPEATASAVRDGWFYTGDLAQRGDNGFLYLAGRSKDIIVTGGYNVSPAEVESVLNRHPDIYQSAVVGIPHREWGEQVTAFVVLKPDNTVSEHELLAFCSEHLTSYKKPKQIRLVDSLPFNSNGKIMRRELRDQYQAAQ